ncbi:MAG: rod shape-determining protein MreC [Alcanivoracaceae bacterium]|nr:rod shape-determining protein MreC [Alcanivoracaceae bacterium]
MASLFSDSNSSGYRLLVAVALCTALMWLDHRTDWLGQPRWLVSFTTAPAHYIANIPPSLGGWVTDQAQTVGDLQSDNDRLRRQLLILQQKTQRLAVLEAENVRLRELLNSSARVSGRVTVAEIVAIEPDPNRHELLLNRGTLENVQAGQAVLDARGLIGQVIETGPMTSRVLLITDATHALSVQVNRNGVRSILAGTGHPDRLQLLYMPDTADVKEGDLLVSTGLGGRYPAGYPVAEVTEIRPEPGQAFLTVQARPVANIDRASHVLLVETDAPVSVEVPDVDG